MILTVIIFAVEGQPDIATTAIVAAGSAVLGAVVGGVASFQVNIALDTRRRKARAAIRRKAKVYTPLRAELIALSRAMNKNDHLTWGIDTKERDPEWPQRGPAWRLWPKLKDDGRAATAASRQVVEGLDQIASDIQTLEEARRSAFSVFDDVGKRAYAEVVGEEMSVRGAWDGGSALLEILQDADETWYALQRTEGEAKFPEIRERFNSDPQVTEMRKKLKESDRQLKNHVNAVISELESRMATIARRHELEGAED